MGEKRALVGVVAGVVAGFLSAVALVGHAWSLAGVVTVFLAGFTAGASVAAYVGRIRSKRSAGRADDPGEGPTRG